MLCDDCKKNEARVHFVVLKNDGTTEMHLCRDCAARYSKTMAGMSGEDYSINDFIRGVIQRMPDPSANAEAQESEQEEKPTEEEASFTCPNCGMSYRDFAQQGKIGCSVCYDTFREELTPLLLRIHGAGNHRGKIPKRAGGTLALKQRIDLLRARQERAVAKEEYEKAAEYRDEIRALAVQLAAQEREKAQEDASAPSSAEDRKEDEGGEA